MDQARFWQMIDGSVAESQGDADSQIDLLADSLRQLPAEEIAGFSEELGHALLAAYSWDLWGAAHLLNAGSTHDEFEAFRAWLVCQGREIFQGAVANPDSLVDVTDPEVREYEGEEFLHLPSQIYEEITGQELDAGVVEIAGGVPKGQQWNLQEEGQLSARLPNLWGRLEAHRQPLTAA